MSHLRSPRAMDLANFASHRDFLLARKKRHTSRTQPIVRAGIHQLIEDKMANRPQVSLPSLRIWNHRKSGTQFAHKGPRTRYEHTSQELARG